MYKNVELPRPDADKFMTFLKLNNIYAEPSYAGYGLIHIEVRVDNDDITEKCNAFLNTL